MIRVSKDPEERKIELMAAASELFLNRGYDQTTVSEIVKQIGVAQGTFYYYFRSKEEILFAILEKETEALMAGFASIPDNRYLDPLEKLRLALFSFFQPGEPGCGTISSLIADPGSSLYQKFHERWDEIRLIRFKPIIATIIREGAEAGLFHTGYPEEHTEILFWGISRYIHNHHQRFDDHEYFSRVMKALQELMEKVLGLEKGSFQLME